MQKSLKGMNLAERAEALANIRFTSELSEIDDREERVKLIIGYLREGKAEIRYQNIALPVAPCPSCGKVNKKHSFGKRVLKDVGISKITIVEYIFGKYGCVRYYTHNPGDSRFYSQPMDHIAKPSSEFTSKARLTAVWLVGKQGLTLQDAVEKMESRYHVYISLTALHEWVVDAGYLFSNEKKDEKKRFLLRNQI